MSLLLEYPNLLDERQSAKLFNGAFVLSQLFGCCAVVFVAIWMGGEGGFAWRKDPDRQFHYHPTFMAMGLLFLQGEAILVYRVFRNERKRVTKLLHMSIHSVALLLAVVALKAVWDSHDLHRSPDGELQPLPNLYSLHSWLGISVVSFYFVQFIGGFLTFFFPGASVSLRKCLLPFHQLFEYAAWHHGCWTVDHNLCAQHLRAVSGGEPAVEAKTVAGRGMSEHAAGISHRRCTGDILSLPFSDDPCEGCIKMADGGEIRLGGMIGRPGEWLELLERDRTLVSPLPVPSVLAPFSVPLVHHFTPPKPTSPSNSVPLCNENGETEGQGGTREMATMNGGAGVENVHPPRPARSASGQRPATSRATLLLQQLRERDVEGGFEATCANGDTPMSSSGCYVFLEFQGETKRSVLPPNVRSVEQIKSLFLRSFPSLSPAQLRSSGVKVYIQNAHSPHRLFYELEDIREVGNQSVLKLFEQSFHCSSPSSHASAAAVVPSRPPRSVPPEEYFSEPDMANWTDSVRTVKPVPLRPASVQPQLDGNGQNHRRTTGQTSLGWREQASDSWQSSSAYSSDSSTSGPYARSGTTTPVHMHIREDHHTQRKVDSLERQLASLSELVRSALLPPREFSGDHWQELAQLHSEVLGFSGNPSLSTVGIGTMSESVSSTVSNTTLPPEKGVAASTTKADLSELAAIRADLEALRSVTIRNALRGRVLLEKTLDRMRTVKGWPRTEQDELEKRKDVCVGRLERLQRALREFEQALENTRSSVLNSTRRLHLNEVDELTGKLGEIGREAVELKMGMPALHRDIEEAMRRTIERLEGEERFLREKAPLVDGCLRRCKTLANVMVTMKKLAMVQDERGGDGRGLRRSIPIRHISIHKYSSRSAPNNASSNANQQNNHPLDAILDELNGSNERNEGR
uniref:Cytochrome b561 domain-containing protein n=1 Tax=Globodera rostochiensis TaxID=31243 RepID=A0A914HBQ7_GLORO